MGTADPLPGFYAGKYAMLPAGIYLRQQVVEQAPKDFEWVTIPPLKGQLRSRARSPRPCRSPPTASTRTRR